MKTLAKPEKFRILSPYLYGYEDEGETHDDGSTGSLWVWEKTVRVRRNGILFTFTLQRCKSTGRNDAITCAPLGSKRLFF